MPEPEQPEESASPGQTTEEDTSGTQPDNNTEPEPVAAISEITGDKPVAALTDEDKEEIAAAVAAVISTGVSAEVASALAADPAVLASVSPEQAAEVFDAVDTGALTEEAAAAIVEAVQDAPTEVKEAFEAVINVFGGAFDEYVPLGSNVSVGDRRTLTAVNAVLTGAATLTAAGAAGSSSPSGGSSTSTSNQNDTAKKPEEEEGEEPAGEIAGESDGTKIRFIYFDEENNMHINWKNFFKKLWKETAALAFTLAGSAVVFVTLSGFTQTVALVATGVALAVHYINVMSDQGDDE